MRRRTSPQRQTILRMVKFAPAPMTSGELRRRLPKLAPATLFRNLEQLVEHGEIFSVDGLDGNRRYVGHAWHEAEFRCQRCGQTQRLDGQVRPNAVDQQVFSRSQVFVTTFRASGLCAACLKELQS